MKTVSAFQSSIFCRPRFRSSKCALSDDGIFLHAQRSCPSTSSPPPSLVFSAAGKQTEFLYAREKCRNFTLKQLLSVREQRCPGRSHCVCVWVCGPEVAMVTSNQFPTPSNAQNQILNNWLSLMLLQEEQEFSDILLLQSCY